MVYLEAPAGVGFSYADNRNYTTDDDQVIFFPNWSNCASQYTVDRIIVFSYFILKKLV